jgi:hypothetical protein
MARWFEGAEEAAFMPVAGGYLLQLPNRWFVGRPQRYLVDETQKAPIQAIMRRRRSLVIRLLFAYFALVVAFILLLVWSMGPHGSTSLSIAIGIGYVVLTIATLVLAPQHYMMRKLAPLLAELPTTEQRIKLADQMRNLAKAMPATLLLMGCVGGAMMTIGDLMVVAGAIHDGHWEGHLVWTGLSLLAGGLLTGYFGSLMVLKKRVRGAAPSPR